MRSAECGMEGRMSIPHSAFRIPHWGGVVRLDEFRSLVERLIREIPAEFRGGVVAMDVSPKALPHPVHGDVYTLGECVPLEWSGSGADLHSPILLYYGSFGVPPPLGRLHSRAGGAGPLFLTLEGLVEPPPGDAVLVVRPAHRLLDLFRRRPALVQEVVEVTLRHA